MTWLYQNSWLLVGSVSGSLVGMMLARNLSFWGRLQSLVIGSLIGIFMGPTIVEIWFSQYNPNGSRIPAAICFLTGSSGVAVMPVIIKRIKDWAGRVQFKVVAEKSSDE